MCSVVRHCQDAAGHCNPKTRSTLRGVSIHCAVEQSSQGVALLSEQYVMQTQGAYTVPNLQKSYWIYLTANVYESAHEHIINIMQLQRCNHTGWSKPSCAESRTRSASLAKRSSSNLFNSAATRWRSSSSWRLRASSWPVILFWF